MKTTTLGLGLVLTISASAAFAADLPSRKGALAAPPVSASCLETNALPVDIFGFTAGSDVADLGAWGAALTANGAFTGRATRLTGVTGVAQIATSPFRCFEIGPYAYLGGTDARARFGGSGSATLYGGGVEFKYKFLGRDVHGVGATLDVDASINGGRFRGILGAGTDSVTNLAVRLFLDRELIAGRLYGALNLEHISSLSNRAGFFVDASQFNVRASLSTKVASNLYLGAEAWYSRSYLGAGYRTYLGDAFFVGPNMFWQINDKWTFNAAYQVQVAGKARALPGDINLNQYNQHVARIKLGYTF